MTQGRVTVEDIIDKPVTSEPSEPARTGETVTVACKLPHGIRLRVFHMEDDFEVVPTGHKQIKKAIQDGEFVIRGTSADGRFSNIHQTRIQPGGYALTYGVPRDLWERWLKDNARSDLVRNGVVFAAARDEDVRKEVSQDDRRAVTSGLEPVDPTSTESIAKRVGRSDRRIKLESVPNNELPFERGELPDPNPNPNARHRF